MRVGYPATVILLYLLMHAATAAAADPEQEKAEVIERVIEIKGTVEKPRVIFIVPRAGLKGAASEGHPLKKSFIEDILKPVYPESLIKEEGLKPLRGGKSR